MTDRGATGLLLLRNFINCGKVCWLFWRVGGSSAEPSRYDGMEWDGGSTHLESVFGGISENDLE